MADNNPLRELEALGQSIWLDSIRRGQILSGGLQKLVDEDGISGETANPSIFEKAIGGSSDYDDTIRDMVNKGTPSLDIYENIAVGDVRMACDVFRPIYDKTGGADGFVSIEVSPKLAYDTQGTIDEARRFFREVERPNVMIKIPGTPQGVPAIEQCLYEGININITLLFAVKAYEEVAWAYIRALERRLNEGKPIHNVASVASFFVSRIDTLADKMLQQKLQQTTDPQQAAKLEALGGKAAIANAKIAYQRFKVIFSGPRFQVLKEKGNARVQRPLWASTSTKNPNYPDTLYVDTLIGPDTINTLPLETIEAYREHGHPRVSIEDDLDGATRVMQELLAAGINIDTVTDQVLEEGVVKFDEALTGLLKTIEEKRAAMASTREAHFGGSFGTQQGDIDAALDAAEKNRVAERVWNKDASLWKNDPAHQAIIKNALGWLNVATQMRAQANELAEFGKAVKDAGFKSVVLCGMGGSSLCVEVLNRTLGSARGYPKLHVLDTTDPATILNLEKKIDPAATLFVIASKSGGTTETLDHYRYFWGRVSEKKGAAAGENFVAITDAGSGLDKTATEQNFRRIFRNPQDIGGRYSALSYFGMVPAALMGIDVAQLLDSAQEMMEACAASVPARQNPGEWLGVVFGTLGQHGRDKITIVTTPALASFGLWAEQLIAESTGKDGKGLVPVAGEPLGAPRVYGNDRLFVYLRREGDRALALDRKVAALEKAGQPVVRLKMDGQDDIGAEFFRWEFAVAIAGALLGIDAFDQPNVQESKDNTKRVLQVYEANGAFSTGEPAWQSSKVSIQWAQHPGGARNLRENIAAFLKQSQPGDYVAFMAYVEQTAGSDAAFRLMRAAVRDTLKVATTLGYGPRFLHSTGQLHKGGENNVLAIQITADDAREIPIPGESYGFSVLKHAQAIGDWQALETHGRRALSIHLKRGGRLADVVGAVQAALGTERAARAEPRPKPRRVAKATQKARRRVLRTVGKLRKTVRKTRARKRAARG